MSVATASISLAHIQRQEADRYLRPPTLKRKLLATRTGTRDSLLGYPSPPMSNSPSPSRRSLVQTTNHFDNRPLHASTSFSGPPQYPLAYPPLPIESPISTFAQSSPLAPPPLAGASGSYSTPRLPESFAPSSLGYQTVPPVGNDPEPSASIGAKTARKSKAHVASACVNCKRAHLSCDVQRPCARCVSSGKQDTCYDVQHKKRGRPRLREEGEFKVDQASKRASLPITSSSSITTPTRPIAATRRRRTDSYHHYMQSPASDLSSYGMQTPGLSAHFAFQAALDYRPPSVSGPSSFEAPTALLDLDLVILRANRTFEQIMGRGQILTGRRLADLAAPADAESFMDIRNNLRHEREAREPAFLPPILHSGQDPLEGVSEHDLERLTHTFSDRTYLWMQTPAGPWSQTFPARVRLAKASNYFAVVTLPSFRPLDPIGQMPPYQSTTVAPFFVAPGVPSPEMYQFQRQSFSQPMPMPANTTSYYPYEAPPPASISFPSPTMASSVRGGYLPIQPASMSSYQHQHQPITTPLPHTYASRRSPIGQPPLLSPQYSSRPSVSDPAATITPPKGIQLPPLGARSSIAAPTMDPVLESTSRGENTSEEDDEGRRGQSPTRKRRRMGIDEVLQ